MLTLVLSLMFTPVTLVNHHISLSKLELFPIQVNVIKWIMSFLTGRSQSTKVSGVCSLSLDITRSIVQGLVLDSLLLLHMSVTVKHWDMIIVS